MGLGQKIRVVFDSAYQQEIKFASGVTLFQDVWQRPEQKTTLWGTVVYVPPFAKAACNVIQNGGHCEDCAKAEYVKKNHPDRPYQHLYCHYSDKGVEYTAKIGDRICVRYDVISEGELQESGTRIHKNLLLMPHGDDVRREWLVDYRRIFLFERDGVKYPVGDNIIAEQVKQAPVLTSEILQLTTEEQIVPGFLKVEIGPYAGRTILVQPQIIQHYHLDENDYSKESCIVSERQVLGILNEAA